MAAVSQSSPVTHGSSERNVRASTPSTPVKTSPHYRPETDRSCCQDLMARIVRAVLHLLLAIRDFFKDLMGYSTGREILTRHPALIEKLRNYEVGQDPEPIIEAFNLLYSWQQTKIAKDAYVHYNGEGSLKNFDPARDLSLSSYQQQQNLLRLKALVTAQEG